MKLYSGGTVPVRVKCTKENKDGVAQITMYKLPAIYIPNSKDVSPSNNLG